VVGGFKIAPRPSLLMGGDKPTNWIVDDGSTFVNEIEGDSTPIIFSATSPIKLVLKVKSWIVDVDDTTIEVSLKLASLI